MVQLDSRRFAVPTSSSIAILRRFAEWLADSNKAARDGSKRGADRRSDAASAYESRRISVIPDMAVEIISSMYN